MIAHRTFKGKISESIELAKKRGYIPQSIKDIIEINNRETVILRIYSQYLNEKSDQLTYAKQTEVFRFIKMIFPEVKNPRVLLRDIIHIDAIYTKN